MGKFQALSVKETNELDELLAIADSIIVNKGSVIKGNQKAAKIVGTAIGGVAGAAIAAGAGTAGVASATAGIVGFGSIAAGGLGVAAVVALPVAIAALIGGGVGWLVWKKRFKGQKGNTGHTAKANEDTPHDSFSEKRRQAFYVKAIIEKMEEILQKYESLKKENDELKRKSKKDDETIRQQKEKLAEYEAIFEALKKKRKDIEKNLSFA